MFVCSVLFLSQFLCDKFVILHIRFLNCLCILILNINVEYVGRVLTTVRNGYHWLSSSVTWLIAQSRVYPWFTKNIQICHHNAWAKLSKLQRVLKLVEA